MIFDFVNVIQVSYARLPRGGNTTAPCMCCRKLNRPGLIHRRPSFEVVLAYGAFVQIGTLIIRGNASMRHLPVDLIGDHDQRETHLPARPRSSMNWAVMRGPNSSQSSQHRCLGGTSVSRSLA